MPTQTEMLGPTAPEPAAPSAVPTRTAFVPVAVPPEAAGNDAAYDDTVYREHELDAWARHAFASNGFGDVATGSEFTAYELFRDAPAPRASVLDDSYDVYREARARQAVVLGQIVDAAVRALSKWAQQVYARYRERRAANDIYAALRQLDDCTLRDLGFDRSELRRVAEETATQLQTEGPHDLRYWS